MSEIQTPHCGSCSHYWVTWDPAQPKGCRAYRFKSQALPSLVVHRESGRPCQLFEERKSPEKGRAAGREGAR